MHRSELTARVVALVSNWWSWYVRAANPSVRREALTSRPLLQAAIAYVRRAAEQLPKIDRWRVLVGYISERLPGK